jgi:cobalt-precorrin 5A hydrolase
VDPVTVVSLTGLGRALAERLRAHLPGAEYLHRPSPFKESIQTRFQTGHRLVLICAAGIAVRTLAPVLRDKLRDPAVVVLDERGEFVIPLVSGHEGGANDWARWLSERLGARCVITSAAPYTHRVLVAGIGCARHCTRETLAELVNTTLEDHGIAPRQLNSLASIELKRNETGLLALAEELGLPIFFYPAADLLRYTERLSQKSEIVLRETGCYGVAEAAALAHAEGTAGTPAELIIPKRKNAQATFALARAYAGARHP